MIDFFDKFDGSTTDEVDRVPSFGPPTEQAYQAYVAPEGFPPGLCVPVVLQSTHSGTASILSVFIERLDSCCISGVSCWAYPCNLFRVAEACIILRFCSCVAFFFWQASFPPSTFHVLKWHPLTFRFFFRFLSLSRSSLSLLVCLVFV